MFPLLRNTISEVPLASVSNPRPVAPRVIFEFVPLVPMSRLVGPRKRSRHLFVSDPSATASSTNGVRSDTNLPLAVMVSVAAFPMNVLPFNVVTPAETSVPEEASVSLAWIVPATSTACSGAVVPIPSRLLN